MGIGLNALFLAIYHLGRRHIWQCILRVTALSPFLKNLSTSSPIILDPNLKSSSLLPCLAPLNTLRKSFSAKDSVELHRLTSDVECCRCTNDALNEPQPIPVLHRLVQWISSRAKTRLRAIPRQDGTRSVTGLHFPLSCSV